ncbi:MAG: hypothetical protein IT370_08990 [Deltaproteobacteria bacterium]|nr:hypothetical protein [Deltaproteobacteria bacterium]
MPSPPRNIYQSLPADDRQDFRLPGLLKEHLTRVSAQLGHSVDEYITLVLSERVARDLAASIEWTLSVDEQLALMKILTASTEPSDHARATAASADALLGPPVPPTAR